MGSGWASVGRSNQGLKAYQAQALIFVGKSYFITPIPVPKYIHDGIKGSRLKVVEDCGHIPWIEQPALFFEEVHAFILDC